MKKSVAILILILAMLLSSCSFLAELLNNGDRKLLEYNDIAEFVLDNAGTIESIIDGENTDDYESLLHDKLTDNATIRSVLVYSNSPKIIKFKCSSKGNAQNKFESGFFYTQKDIPCTFEYRDSDYEKTDSGSIIYNIDEPGDCLIVQKICDHWWYYYIKDI